jgi:hypothetical protein
VAALFQRDSQYSLPSSHLSEHYSPLLHFKFSVGEQGVVGAEKKRQEFLAINHVTSISLTSPLLKLM